jgi:N-acetylglucosaminyldiphosphoundecaprenol N-acetyl-beta-D-mannosaminyltransferase
MSLRPYNHTVKILDVEFDTLTIDDFCNIVSDSIIQGNKIIIASQNLHGIYIVHKDPSVKSFYDKVSKIHIDGMPLVYLARIFGYPARREHRITYLDIIFPLMDKCAKHGWRVYYLGGKPGVSDVAANHLRLVYPKLQIETHHGYFQKTGIENVEILNKLRDFKTQVVMVGLGMPLQERWILENFDQIEANVILTTGACFDYLAGVVATPPRWMGWVGLEWLFRLLSEPKRLWRRYLVEPWYILFLVIKELIRK